MHIRSIFRVAVEPAEECIRFDAVARLCLVVGGRHRFVLEHFGFRNSRVAVFGDKRNIVISAEAYAVARRTGIAPNVFKAIFYAVNHQIAVRKLSVRLGVEPAILRFEPAGILVRYPTCIRIGRLANTGIHPIIALVRLILAVPPLIEIAVVIGTVVFEINRIDGRADPDSDGALPDSAYVVGIAGRVRRIRIHEVINCSVDRSESRKLKAIHKIAGVIGRPARLTADEFAVFELKPEQIAVAIVDIFGSAVGGNSVFAEIIFIFADLNPALRQLAVREQHIQPVFVGHHAGVTFGQNLARAADAAGEISAVVNPCMASILAAAVFVDGIRIEYLSFAADYVVRRNCKFRIARGNGQIDGAVIVRRDIEVEAVGLDDIVRLFARRTADDVHRPVLGIHFAARHRFGTGVRMVVPREYNVDTGLVHRCGNVVVDGEVAARRVGIVRRLVHNENFPQGAARLCVFDHPRERFLQVGDAARIRIVDDSHVHVAVGYRVILFIGQHVDCRAEIPFGVALIFVVAHRMNHVDAAEIPREGFEHSRPLLIGIGAVDKVARLRAEAVIDAAPTDELSNRRDRLSVRIGSSLRVADDEEVGIFASLGRGEILDRRPRCTVADLIDVLRIARKPGERYAVDARGDILRRVGKTVKLQNLRRAVQRGSNLRERFRRAARLLVGGLRCVANDGFARGERVGQPADCLLRFRIRHRLRRDIERRAVRRHGGHAVDRLYKGNIAGGVLRIQRFDGGRADEICGNNLPFFVGRVEQGIIHIDADAGGGNAVVQNGDNRAVFVADNGRLNGKIVVSQHFLRNFLRGNAVYDLLVLADRLPVEHDRARLHGIGQADALNPIFRDGNHQARDFRAARFGNRYALFASHRHLVDVFDNVRLIKRHFKLLGQKRGCGLQFQAKPQADFKGHGAGMREVGRKQIQLIIFIQIGRLFLLQVHAVIRRFALDD